MTDDRPPLGPGPRVRDQAALTTSQGGSWMLMGGLLTLIAVAFLFAMLRLNGQIAAVAICVDVVLYAAMVLVRVNVARQRVRLALLAVGMLAIAIVSLGSVAAIALHQW